MLFGPREVVFTAASERDSLARMAGWIRPRLRSSSVIPIGSNLPDTGGSADYCPALFSFWGMFHRGKGLELLLHAFRRAVQREQSLRLILAGAYRERDSDYIERVRLLARDNGIADRVEMLFNRSGTEVAGLLRRSCAAVLPFSDGATFRRGTLVAALQLGVPVITTRGPDTPEELKDGVNVLFANSEGEIADRMVALANDPAMRSSVSAHSLLAARRFRWECISEEHLRLYRSALGR